MGQRYYTHIHSPHKLPALLNSSSCFEPKRRGVEVMRTASRLPCGVLRLLTLLDMPSGYSCV